MGAAAAAAKLLQLCLTLCDPISGSPPGSPVPGILQARTLEWLAISFSNAWKWKVKEVAQLYPTLSFPMLHPTRLLHPWDFPGKSTGVGCHCLLHPYGRQAAKNKRAASEPSDQHWQESGHSREGCGFQISEGIIGRMATWVSYKALVSWSPKSKAAKW